MTVIVNIWRGKIPHSGYNRHSAYIHISLYGI